MKTFREYRIFFLLICLQFACLNFHAETLSSKNADWTNVIGGKAICTPKQTSYGFAVLTDGKMISACSERGVKLWEKKVPGHPDMISVFSSDFLLSVSGGKNLSLINPSGLCLWTVKVPFEITNEPISGLDSRIFVKGKKNIACYGINGVCKWILNLETLRPEQLFQMNDGTLTALLESVENNKTKAVRFSPFGEIEESITFSSIILSAESVNGGMLLSFAGGGAGMCSVQEGKTTTKWWIPFSDKAFSNSMPDNGTKFISLAGNRGALAAASQNSTRIMVFSLKDGRISDFFDIPTKFPELKCLELTGDGTAIFAANQHNAWLFDINGKISWKCSFPKSDDAFSRWNQIFLSKQNSLVLCSESWAIAGFKVSQKLTAKATYKTTSKTTSNRKKQNYNSFFLINKDYLATLEYSNSLGTKIIGINRKKILATGNYGEKEKEFVSALASFNIAYRTFLMQSNSGARLEQKSIFQRDLPGMERIFLQFNSFGTEQFLNDISYYIINEQNSYLLASLLRSLKDCGFDPNDTILSAIETRLPLIPPHDAETLFSLCDAVYEICRFMGRPALFNHGIRILTGLISPQYSSAVQNHARNTLSKITLLKI